MDLRQPLQVLALSPSGNLLAVACGRFLSVVDIKSVWSEAVSASPVDTASISGII